MFGNIAARRNLYMFLSQLPSDCAFEIFSFLPLRDLVRAERVSINMHRYVEHIVVNAPVFSLQTFIGIGPKHVVRMRRDNFLGSSYVPPTATFIDGKMEGAVGKTQIPQQWHRLLYRMSSLCTLDLSMFLCSPKDVENIFVLLSGTESRSSGRRCRTFPKLETLHMNRLLCNTYGFFAALAKQYKSQIRNLSIVQTTDVAWLTHKEKAFAVHLNDRIVKSVKSWPLLESLEIEDFAGTDAHRSADAMLLYSVKRNKLGESCERTDSMDEIDQDHQTTFDKTENFAVLQHVLVNCPRYLYELSTLPIGSRLTSVSLSVRRTSEDFLLSLSNLKKRSTSLLFPLLTKFKITGLSLMTMAFPAESACEHFVDFLLNHRTTLRELEFDDVCFGRHAVRSITAIPELEVLKYNDVSFVSELHMHETQVILETLTRLRSFQYKHVELCH